MSKNITPRWVTRRWETQRELNSIRAFAIRQIAHVLKDEEKAVGATHRVAQEKERIQK